MEEVKLNLGEAKKAIDHRTRPLLFLKVPYYFWSGTDRSKNILSWLQGNLESRQQEKKEANTGNSNKRRRRRKEKNTQETHTLSAARPGNLNTPALMLVT